MHLESRKTLRYVCSAGLSSMEKGPFLTCHYFRATTQWVQFGLFQTPKIQWLTTSYILLHNLTLSNTVYPTRMCTMYNACILAIGVGNVRNVSEVIFAAGGLDIVGLQRSTVGVLHLQLPQLHKHTHTFTYTHTHTHKREKC